VATIYVVSTVEFRGHAIAFLTAAALAVSAGQYSHHHLKTQHLVFKKKLNTRCAPIIHKLSTKPELLSGVLAVWLFR
jgi:hypothetical protein